MSEGYSDAWDNNVIKGQVMLSVSPGGFLPNFEDLILMNF